MSRLDAAFRGAESSRLVAYVTAGDPDLPRSRAILVALAAAGANVIEVGVPFSDPIADGPVIQRASERAMAAGTTLTGTIDMIASVRREIDTPLVLFTYFNPVLAMGVERFVSKVAAAGVDGVLLLDLPIEESEGMKAALDAEGIDLIFLISPTTTEGRLRVAARLGRGFLYAISRLGVTGARDAVATSAEPLVARIRAVTDLPIALGFGISRPDHVREVTSYADAAVVGSAIVQVVADTTTAGGDEADAVGRFVSWLKSPLESPVRR